MWARLVGSRVRLTTGANETLEGTVHTVRKGCLILQQPTTTFLINVNEITGPVQASHTTSPAVQWHCTRLCSRCVPGSLAGLRLIPPTCHIGCVGGTVEQTLQKCEGPLPLPAPLKESEASKLRMVAQRKSKVLFAASERTRQRWSHVGGKRHRGSTD